MLGYAKSDSANNMFVCRIEHFDAHNRHLVYCLRSRILDSDNSIVVCLNDCFYIRLIHVDLTLYIVKWP